MLPIEAMQFSVNTIADVNYKYEHHTRKLQDRDKCFAKHFKQLMALIIPSEQRRPWAVGTFQYWSKYERYDHFADTQTLKAFPMSIAKATSQRHTEHRHHKITATVDVSG